MSDVTPNGEKPAYREWIEAILVALLLALVIRSFLVQAFKIPSASMEPTLLIGDHILVNKFAYGIRNPFSNETWIPVGEPSRGDVIVFLYPRDPDKNFIKRVIGLPGENVEVRNRIVYVDGVAIHDPTAHFKDPPSAITAATRANFGPKRVPEGNLFVMGDNRDRSSDSRVWGWVQQEEVVGKAFIIYWSWDSVRNWVRATRLADLIY